MHAIRACGNAMMLSVALSLGIMIFGYCGSSSSQGVAIPKRNPPDGFRGIKWDSTLPPVQKLRETALGGCSTVVEQKNFTDTPPCSHMHIATDDMELFSQRRTVAPIFGVAVSEQVLTWSHRKFWSGEVFIYDYSGDDLAKLRGALTNQYGDPNFGQGRIAKWSWPAKKVVIQLSFDPVPKPSLGTDKTRRTSISLLFSKTE